MLLEDQGLTPQGTFYFFTAISIIGALWVWFCIPEAAGLSLESIDHLFDLPWYKIGLSGRKFAEEYEREHMLEDSDKYMDEKERVAATATYKEG